MFGRVKPLKWSSAKLAYFDYWKGRLYRCAAQLEQGHMHPYEALALAKGEIDHIRRNCPR